jgi:hypothetical protein
MDAAEQEAARAKELTRLNASAKGFRSQFVSTRNILVQALPLYEGGPTASRRRMVDEAIARIGLQADKVHDAYQRLIEFDDDERHHANFETRQQNTATKINNILAHADEVLGEVDGPQHGGHQQQPGQIQGDIIAATVAAMNAANGGNAGPKKIDYHLKPKILGKDFTTSEPRTWCSGMVFFWAAQAIEDRDVEIRRANLYDCMHSPQKNYFEPRMPPGIGICNPRNVDNDNAYHRTALEIVQVDHETKWPIHTRRVNLFKQEQKEDQSFYQWHIHLYNLGEDAKVDELTGRDWLLFLLVQSCKLNELRKKILNLPDKEITLENVLALARKYESTEVACKEKDTINKYFHEEGKEGRKGNAVTARAAAKRNAVLHERERKGKSNRQKKALQPLQGGSTFEHRQNCPAKADTCTNCNKKGHRAVICHNGKRVNANGQVASSSATQELGAKADFAKFQAFRQQQRQQQNQQQRQQHQQSEE